MIAEDLLRRFYIMRHVDRTGCSGVGIIAVGVRMPSGKCIIEWLRGVSNVSIFENMEDMKYTHGHGDSTEFVWYDDSNGDKKADERLISALKSIYDQGTLHKPGTASSTLRQVTEIAGNALSRENGNIHKP